MRRLIPTLGKVALAETAVVVLSLFAAPFFPLGDIRWLLIGIGSIALLAIWVYIEYRFARRKKEKQRYELKFKSQIDNLIGRIEDTLGQVDRKLLVDIAQNLDVLNESFEMLSQKLDDLLELLKPPTPDK